jgi:DNA mismatch repair protein MutL
MSAPGLPNRIALLPGTLVNQIAAGEVIERPASVVKELIENSIDAGATRIDIDIEAGGTRSIIIRDNGSGIHPDDMEIAVLRHATSKLRTSEDLETIATLGFRGEALSSIASVSGFTLTSRIAGEPYARRLRMDPALGVTELAPAAHPPGTSIEVMNLFYNVPARRKFLRSERTEFLHILEMVKNLVMSRLDIQINLRHNGRAVLSCPAVESDFKARLSTIMGAGFYNNSRPIDVRAEQMHIHGWIGMPVTARSQSDQQYLYLNNRVIRDRQITHAIRMAVEAEIPAARYPAYILNLQIEPTLVDVNVHPTKQEVRFRYARDVHDFVFAALRASGECVAAGDLAGSQGPVQRSASKPGASRLRELAPAYQAELRADRQSNPLGVPLAVLEGDLVVMLQNDSLCVLDFHRTRQHYLHHRLQQELATNGIRARPLLVPLLYTATERDITLLTAYLDVLARYGLQIDLSGPQSLVVRTLPTLLPDLEIQPLLSDMFAGLKNAETDSVALGQTLLELLALHGTRPSSGQYTLAQMAGQLQQMAHSGLVIAGPECAGLWRSWSPDQLRLLLNEHN